MSVNRTITTIKDIPLDIKQKIVELYQNGNSISKIQRDLNQYGFSYNTIKRIAKPEWEQKYKEIQAKYNNKSTVKEKKNKVAIKFQKTKEYKAKLSKRFKIKWRDNKEFRKIRSDRFKKWFEKNGHEYCKEYYHKDIELSRKNVRASARRRRAKKRILKEYYTQADEVYTRQLFENKCAICGSIEKLVIDHWYPLSKGYILTRQNAVLMCQHCNCSKSWKMPEEIYDKETVDKIKAKLLN